MSKVSEVKDIKWQLGKMWEKSSQMMSIITQMPLMTKTSKVLDVRDIDVTNVKSDSCLKCDISSHK